ncbi:MAG: glycosyltransferase family 4 protein, partial [Candidatus Binataceae bacterium]
AKAVRQVPAIGLPRTLGLLYFAWAGPALARREGAELTLSFARAVGADILRSGGGAHVSYVRAARQWRGSLAADAMWIAPYHRAQMAIERCGFSSPSLRKVIAVSDLVRDDLVRRFNIAGAKAVTLYNGVDLERFAPQRDENIRQRIRRGLGLDAATPMVAFVGNGFARKGLRFLLAAWPKLKSSTALAVVGSDRASASYERLARRLGIGGRVSFLGRQARAEDFFHACDVVALPSLFEPFGNVVMEAMASGVPALTSARCGVAEILPAAMRPFVVDNPCDSEEIAAKLDALIESRFEVAGAARPRAEEFTWERYARGLLDILGL